MVIRSAVSVNRKLNAVYCDHCKGISVMVGLQMDCVCTHRIVSLESQSVLKQERNQNKKYAELMYISNVIYFYSFYIQVRESLICEDSLYPNSPVPSFLINKFQFACRQKVMLN